MAEKAKLSVEERTLLGKKVGRLRRAGIMPATIYGKGVGPFTVQTDAKAFTDLYRKTGNTSLVELSLTGQPMISAFVHTIQRHPVTRNIVHVDFLAVDLKVEVTVEVPVQIIGTSPLVKTNEGVINLMVSTVAVRALPGDIPSHVDADISVLDALDKNVYASDLKLSAGTLAIDPETVIVAVTPGTREEDLEPTPATEEPELVRKERDDEE
jgi:large subunit ribosomal protein L25